MVKTCAPESKQGICGEIEQKPPVFQRGEKMATACILCGERLAKFCSNLIGVPPNSGSNPNLNRFSGRAKSNHRFKGCFQNTLQTTAPAGMRRTDNLIFGICEQHRQAIRCQHSKGEAFLIAHQGIRAVWQAA